MQPYTQSSPSYPKTMDSATRIVRLCRIGKSSLGFSIRGGWEHGTGVYISEVHPGSEAFREGLKPGDQILRVNGFIIEQAIHEEVIALIKSSSRITLKVKSVGMIPIKSNRSETLSWKLIDSSKMSPSKTPATTTTIHVNGNNLKTINNNNNNHMNNNKSSSNSSVVSSLNSDSNSNSSDGSNTNGHHHHHQHLHRTHHHSHHPGPPPPPPPCPVHSVWSTFSSKSSSSNRSSLSSSQSSEDQSSCPDKDLFTSYGMTHGDYMEARVFIRIAPGQGLGCSVVKGPSNYPGIFVQTIKEGGIAQESGLEVGDQIIAMNGLSMEPGDIEFNEAIARIKSTSQMTLTVRKKSGLSLFQQHHNHHSNSDQPNGNYSHSNQHHARHSHHPYHHTNGNSKQRVKAIVHSPPISTTTNGSGISKAAAAAAVAAAAEEIYHSPLLNKSSSESSSSPFNGSSRFYPPSEHDYSMSEVESNGNYVMRIPIGHENSGKETINSVDRSSPGRSDVSAATAKIYDKVRREEERLAEERKKLESEQKRLQAELEKLEKERKQLENMKPQDDSKSISSSSTISGSGNPSISSSGSTSQLGFLDEIKKLAEKRLNENGLITDTLNKTRNLEKMMTKGPKTLISGQDDENRKRHELLMEEFRAAHSKMFGSGERKLRDIKNIGSNCEEKMNNNNNINNCNTINQQQNGTQINSQTNGDPSQKQQSNGLPNGQPKGQLNGQEMLNQNNVVIINNNINNNKLIESPVVTIKSIPPPIQQTITNSNGETVTILRTTSPCKKLIPPPIPVKKSTSSPIVTITSYESCKK